MSESLVYVNVNEKKEYHDCEMIFSFYLDYKADDFEVDSDVKYKINTTLKELFVLNEALTLYQKKGFKDNYLAYASVLDGSQQYPNFVIDYIDSVELTKQLQGLANDEDSLVQLNSYCLDTPPTYEDDFRINKKIEAIIYQGESVSFKDADDIEEYLEDKLF